jgi:hypothetical protein
VGRLTAADTVDYIKADGKQEYIEYILWSTAWLRALLGGRFDIFGLGELVHAVFQIGVGYGLLLNVFIEV